MAERGVGSDTRCFRLEERVVVGKALETLTRVSAAGSDGCRRARVRSTGSKGPCHSRRCLPVAVGCACHGAGVPLPMVLSVPRPGPWIRGQLRSSGPGGSCGAGAVGRARGGKRMYRKPCSLLLGASPSPCRPAAPDGGRGIAAEPPALPGAGVCGRARCGVCASRTG